MMKLEADLDCPKCGRSFKIQIEDMSSGNSHLCSSCGTTIQFKGDGGRKAQKALDDFHKSLKRTFR